MTVATACELLGEFIASAGYSRLPAEVTSRVKQGVQDSLGCLLAAYSTDVATILRPYLETAGSGDSTVIGSTRQLSADAAAHANALLINALDYDDIYRKGHLSATTVAAGLAVGEMIDCSGEELIAALAVGYEVSGRIGTSLRHIEPRKLIHGHGTWQAFGAAAVTARLLRLDAQQAAHALAVCGVNAPVASVMKTVYGTAGATMAKNNFGVSAATGVSSALLARSGFEGPLDLLEGETGFWRMAGADEFDSQALLDDLGERFETLHIGFKPFSCCRILQGSIEAVLHAAARIGCQDPAEIQRIEVEAAPILGRLPFNSSSPRTMWDAQFSAPFVYAMALLRVPPGPDWFAARWCDDHEVSSLMSKVTIAPLANATPVSARATVVLRDGRSARAEVGIPCGEASNPMSQEALDTKFLRLAQHRLTLDDARTLLGRVHALEREPSVRSWVRAIGPAYRF